MALKTRVLVLVIVVACLRYCVHCQPHFFPANQQDMLMRGQLFTALPGSGARSLPVSTFPRAGAFTGRRPFSNIFGSGLNSPSPLGLLNRDDFSSSTGRGDPFSSTSREENYASLTRNHPFSSIRLNPVPSSKGVSLSRPRNNPFERRRDRFSLFDSDNAKKYSLDSPSTFEKPISKTTLPDVNSPITLDLANDEQERVAYAKQKGKLPPARHQGLHNDVTDDDRPSLHRDEDRSPRLGKRLLSWERPSSLPPMPGRLAAVAPVASSLAGRQPASQTGQSGDDREDETDSAPYFDDTAPFIEDAPEVKVQATDYAQPNKDASVPSQDNAGFNDDNDTRGPKAVTESRPTTPFTTSKDADNEHNSKGNQDPSSELQTEELPSQNPTDSGASQDVSYYYNEDIERLPHTTDSPSTALPDGHLATKPSSNHGIYSGSHDDNPVTEQPPVVDPDNLAENSSALDAAQSLSIGAEPTSAHVTQAGESELNGPSSTRKFAEDLDFEGVESSPTYKITESQPATLSVNSSSSSEVGYQLPLESSQAGVDRADIRSTEESSSTGPDGPETTTTSPQQASTVVGDASSDVGADSGPSPGDKADADIVTVLPLSVVDNADDHAVVLLPNSSSDAVNFSGLEQPAGGKTSTPDVSSDSVAAEAQLNVIDLPNTTEGLEGGTTTPGYIQQDPPSPQQLGTTPVTDNVPRLIPDNTETSSKKEKRNPEIALNVGGASSSPRVPLSPFERMFGHSLQDAYQQTFGSLFGSLNRGEARPGATLSRGPAGFLGTESQAFGAGNDRDLTSLDTFPAPYGSGKNLFDTDINGIVNQRPSLHLFGRK